MKIAIADTMKPSLQAYMKWIERGLPGSEIVPLSCILQNLADLYGSDGLVLTGGGDIHPRYYGREDSLPVVQGVNESRDEFEFTLIKQALDSELPLLGVCRGMQAFNVARGGTLIMDVQAAGYQNHGKEKGLDRRHNVRLEENTILHSIAGTSSGEVNSSHHQALDKLGNGLKVSAWSSDGIIEGVEWEHAEGKPFLQLVQWHPERMEDFENPLSRGLIERFAKEVQISRV